VQQRPARLHNIKVTLSSGSVLKGGAEKYLLRNLKLTHYHLAGRRYGLLLKKQ
jgi:hypothetical protein